MEAGSIPVDETLKTLMEPRLDIVVDAIDSVNCKVGLLEYCVRNDIPVISSMGAGGRLDGSRIQAGDLFHTRNCPLARFIRKRLRNRGIRSGIRCVHSLEDCRNDLLPMPEDVEIHDGPGRSRTPLGTISYLPMLFGLRVAEEVIALLLQGRRSHQGSASPTPRP